MLFFNAHVQQVSQKTNNGIVSLVSEIGFEPMSTILQNRRINLKLYAILLMFTGKPDLNDKYDFGDHCFTIKLFL